ncbi:hypothetical protein VNO77_33617 [Canavalia gladiata]|uniref:Uncharacterized protein n=1 Tax=Canavalia gladiata TaxID=3824 RepID=A0AAN9KC60_CANGL
MRKEGSAVGIAAALQRYKAKAERSHWSLDPTIIVKKCGTWHVRGCPMDPTSHPWTEVPQRAFEELLTVQSGSQILNNLSRI